MGAKPSKTAPEAPAPATLTPEQKTTVDEFGELDRKYRLAKPDLDKYEALKKVIKGWYAEFPADKTTEAEGDRYIVQVSVCEMESTPDKRKIYRLLRPKLFLEIADVTQKAVKEALETLKKSDQFGKLFSKARTGSRTLTAVAKSSPAPAAEKKAA